MSRPTYTPKIGDRFQLESGETINVLQAIGRGRSRGFTIRIYGEPGTTYKSCRAMRRTLDAGLARKLDEHEAVCRGCGCTTENCQQCIDATGFPCSWTGVATRNGREWLCSRCAKEGKS